MNVILIIYSSYARHSTNTYFDQTDALQRDLLGDIVSRFERKGMKIVGMKFLRLTSEMLDEHYAHLSDKPFFVSLKNT